MTTSALPPNAPSNAAPTSMPGLATPAADRALSVTVGRLVPLDGAEDELVMLAAAAAGLAHGLIDVSYALPELMIVWVLLFGLVPHAPDSLQTTATSK